MSLPWTGRRTPSRSCARAAALRWGGRAGTGPWSSCPITWAGGSICWTPRDDLEEDRAAGRYNPVAARFDRRGPDAMARTLDHSRNLIISAAQLADFCCRWPLIENILYRGSSRWYTARRV